MGYKREVGNNARKSFVIPTQIYRLWHKFGTAQGGAGSTISRESGPSPYSVFGLDELASDQIEWITPIQTGSEGSPPSNSIQTPVPTPGSRVTPGGTHAAAQDSDAPRTEGTRTFIRIRPDGSSLSVTVAPYIPKQLLFITVGPNRLTSLSCRRRHPKYCWFSKPHAC